MARISSPTYRLFYTRLQHAFERGQAEDITKTIFGEWGIKTPVNGFGVPYALRWTSSPSFGFPRQPFKLWRRVKKYRSRTVLGVSRDVVGERIVNVAQGELYQATLTLNLAPGQQLKIQALDRDDNSIPGTELTVNSSGIYEIQSPFIKKLKFQGNGRIDRIIGVVQSELINDPDWELIQRVGFPFPSGSIPSAAYNPDPQGWADLLPIDARDFAYRRLLLGQMMHENMQALPNPTLPLPMWKAPDPNNFLFQLADHPTSLLHLVKECLETTNDSSPDPKDRQQGYLAERKVEGLRQEGFPGTVEPGIAMIPVVSTTILSASTDNYAALALGYGTYDFAPNMHESNNERGYDYMVTNEFMVRPFEESIFPFDFSYKAEFAALSEFRPRPTTPNFLSVEGKNQNRPLVRDAASDETVQLRFSAPDFPQGYGVVKSDSNRSIRILNNERHHNPDSYDPHIPDIPNPENVPVAPCTFTDSTSPIPLEGTEQYTYFLAGVDIFGRWSSFDQHSYTARALPPQRPGITSVRLKEVLPLPPGSPSSIPCTLEIECTWDWTERSPEKIELGGGFYPTDQETGIPAFTDRFAHQSSNAPLPLIEITFAADGTPSASGADHEVVQIIPTDPGADPNLRRYKVTVSNLSSTFPGPLLSPATPPAMNPSRVAYAVTARALEKVQAVSPPDTWSPWIPVVIDKLDDPRPPVMVSLPASVNWTALPDAGNVARGKLSWPIIPRAAGYVVWEAPETALREFLGLSHRPNDSYVDRATELETYLSNPANEMNSLKAFVRLNRELIRGTSIELSLPGAADTLFVYRVSAMSVSNMESSRSNAVFFAVPRQNTPGPPRLKLEVSKNTTSGIKVIALEGAGPAPIGYKVYRVSKSLASNVVQMKGLPIILEDDPGWSTYQLQNRDGTVSNGMKILNPIASPSWKPYYYQAVAVGQENITQGVLQGESEGSPTEVTYFPPDGPPILSHTTNQLTGTTHFIAFHSNIPLNKLEIGSARLEIISYQGAAGAIPKRETIFIGEVPNLPRTLLPYSAGVPTLPDVTAIPDIAVLESTQTTYIRMAPEIRKVIIKVQDPLGRTAEIFFDEP